MADIVKKITIKGFVQGVGFRYSLCDEAIRRKLKGWVRNTSDGHVEAALQGPLTEVEALINWARKGPPTARVDNLDVHEETGNFKDFDIRY